ncbi:AbfB domain-containing protein [Streptomyces sp. NPDC046261]|uniref:AbfB domain-containing protein n=1 Tax=Streptomyces sp. NPDC046261 TaxID=3157200 RepID=UPI0033FC689F
MKKSQAHSARVRRAITRGIVTTTALAAVAGIAAPGAAVAQPSDAVAPAVQIGTSEEERVAAASKVDLDPTAEVLLLSDHDFIHALWQKARDKGQDREAVRLAAEAAMMSSAAEDHVRFITTGIGEAFETDKQRMQERADADRAARLAKSQALIVVGIPGNPDLLGLSDDNFIRAVMKHDASGPEVKNAAARALAGDASAWQEFITNGVREAHQRDVTNELAELEKKNREEAERRKELAARKNTAALFGITPSEAMLALSDDNFIRELLRLTTGEAQKTELYAAGQKAVLSADTAQWKLFIHTGAEQAYKRDDEARRKKIADTNRRRALAIQAAAEKTGMNPHLVATAKKALAGSDEDVANFLKEDSQYHAKRQSFTPSGGKQAGWYIRQSSVDGGEAFVAPVDAKGKQTDREDATWVVVQALANKPGCYSFESARKPGYYLTQKDLRARMSANDASAQFAKDATWCPRKGLTGSGTSFESASQPGRWLRHFWGDLYAADKSGKGGRFNTAENFAQDATWKLATPLAR